MRTGILKAAIPALLVCLAALALAACGSGGEDSTTAATARPAVSPATADRLAKLSDRIATNLDAGDLCHAAHAADDLHTAVQESDLSANLRPGVDTVATDLVNQVNCPPPPAPSEPEKKPKKPQDENGDHGPGGEHGNGNGEGRGPGDDQHHGHSGHGGFGPPGHAKLQGEQG
jgi:hypothetical protein